MEGYGHSMNVNVDMFRSLADYYGGAKNQNLILDSSLIFTCEEEPCELSTERQKQYDEFLKSEEAKQMMKHMLDQRDKTIEHRVDN